MFDDPLSALRREARTPGQIVLPIEIPRIAAETAKDVERLRRRGPELVGQIVRNRYLAHNAWVLAGTRIPTAAVWDFRDAGYDVDGIIAEYPTLTAEDVRAAIRFEELRRAS